MYVSRLAFYTVPGKTGEVEQALQHLRALVTAAGGSQPRILHTHYASLGAPDLVFEHFRKRTREEGQAPAIDNRYDCDLKPGAKVREKGTVQTASVDFRRDVSEYGDRYYLVVPRNPNDEGSYGTNSSAVERPQGSAVCIPTQVLGTCP